MKVICKLSNASYVICLCVSLCVPAIISIHLVVRFCWGKEKGHVYYKAGRQEIKKKRKNASFNGK